MNQTRHKPANWSVSVKNFVEFTRDAGHLASQGTWRAGANEGRQAHLQLQQQRPTWYEAEAPIEGQFTSQHLKLKIRGRIDGRFHTPHCGPTPVLEEIKTTVQNPTELQPREAHWLQLLCYAWLFLRQHACWDACLIQLTYFNAQLNQEKRFMLGCTLALLEPYFAPKLERYQQWISHFFSHRTARNQYLATLSFPFEHERPEQVEIMSTVTEVLKTRSQLLLEASTGIGKTAAVTFPALKHLARSTRSRVISLSAKITTQRNTLEFLDQLPETRQRLKVLQLSAQSRLCPCQPGSEPCDRLKDYYKKIEMARVAAFKAYWLDSDTILSIANTYALCPYRLQLALLPWVDVVIGDYNYLFDPRVNILPLIDSDLRQSMVLIDECHNLIDRARQMYSGRIEFSRLEQLQHTVFSGSETASKLIRSFMTEAKRIMHLETQECRLPSPALEHIAQELQNQLAVFLRQQLPPIDSEILEAYFTLNFLHRLMSLNCSSIHVLAQSETSHHNARAQHRLQQTPEKSEPTALTLFCVNPAPLLEPLWARLGGAILYSGTLQPAEYYRKMLGLDAQPGSQFQRHIRQFCEQVDTRILPLDLRYRSRHQQVPLIVETIASMTRTLPGNHFVFFPSYQFMNQVHQAFMQAHPEIDTVVQRPGMNFQERDLFLARFANNPDRPLVGFVLLGGVFSEGVDLPGDRLMGVMLLTVGLPVPSPENQAIEHYFSDLEGKGFAHAYLYPSFCRTLQASGRLIRTDEDEGLLILADARFAQPAFLEAFAPYNPRLHEQAPEETEYAL